MKTNTKKATVGIFNVFTKKRRKLTEAELLARRTAVFNTWLSIDLRRPYKR